MRDFIEILLTADEIKQIEKFVFDNPHLSDPNCFNIGNTHTSIVKVSPTTGLIIVEGNDDTGFQHIHARHEYYSFSPYWVDAESDGMAKKKLQDPSKFNPNSVPFWDYIKIADSIYKSENINIENNKRLDDFDLYIGPYLAKDGSQEFYKLLLYKGTKVIHTLYPKNQKYNRKKPKDFNLARGIVNGNISYKSGIVEITIPYKDHENKTKYSILVKKNLNIMREECFVLIHGNDGTAESFVSIGNREFKEFKEVPFETMIWQQADLRGFEEHIKHIDKHIKNIDEKNVS